MNGINNVNTSSVERRFQLPSSRVGMISSSYDLSAAILGIFISYMGSGRQKAKWLTVAAIIMAVGSFVMALPHFVTGPYEWGRNVELSCRADGEYQTSQTFHLVHFAEFRFKYTRFRSAIGNVSECRSRGREFVPGPVSYFHGNWQ